MEEYYFQQLDKAGKSVYNAMYKGYTELATSFQIPILDNSTISYISVMLRLDHPEIFWAETFNYRFYDDSGYAEVTPEYLFDKKKIPDHQKAIRSRVEKLARQVEGKSDMDKLIFIHDFICENVRYDKLKKQYSHEVIGPLTQGVGVCEGFAKAVKMLCDQLGIWCIVVFSDPDPERKTKYGHAWNIVKIGGQYYHLDATFDNTLSRDSVTRYDYFMLADSQAFKDHCPSKWRVPACPDNNHFYYKEKKFSWTKKDEVLKRIGQAAKKGKPLVFHWRGGYFSRSMFVEMKAYADEIAKKKNLQSRIAVNMAQAVVKIWFETEGYHDLFLLEWANEAEDRNAIVPLKFSDSV